MNINEYTDPLDDPKTIAKAHPKYNKYRTALIILGIVILFFIPAATGIPAIALFVLILIIPFIILFVKRRKFLSSIFDEINVSGNSPSWWNDSNKKYRKLAQKTPQERITQDITHKFTRCLIEIPFDIAILFLGFILTFGILPVGICILIFGIARIIINIKNAHGYYVMNHQDSIRQKEAQKQARQETKAKKKEAAAMQKNAAASAQEKVITDNVSSQEVQCNTTVESASNIDIMNHQDSIQKKDSRKQAKQEAKAKKKEAAAMQKNAVASAQKKASTNNVTVQQTQSSAPTKSASNTAAKAVVGAAAAYATGKAVGNAIRNADTPYKRQAQKNKEAFQRQLNYSNDHPRATQTKERITSKGKTYTLTTMPGGNQSLVDASGRLIGQYLKIDNKTFGKDGRFVGNGNLIRTLI